MNPSMHENALMRQLVERRELMAELVRMDNPQADLDRHRFGLLQRADHFAIQIARTSPHCRDDVLALAELVYDLAGTPVIRRAASLSFWGSGPFGYSKSGRPLRWPPGCLALVTSHRRALKTDERAVFGDCRGAITYPCNDAVTRIEIIGRWALDYSDFWPRLLETIIWLWLERDETGLG